MKIKTVYLPLHNWVVTGGIEAIYQLYYALKTLGKDVKLLLLDSSIEPQHNPNWLELHKENPPTGYPGVYKKYKIDPNDITSEVEDLENNFIVSNCALFCINLQYQITPAENLLYEFHLWTTL